jgi:predicted secreted protein
MPRRLGHDYKLYVNNGSGTYNPIAGEVSLQVQRSTNLIDQSAKGDGAYSVQAPGKTQVTINVSGKLQLPDVNGLERLHTLAKDRDAGDIQIRLDPWASDDVIFAASMYVSNFSTGADDDDNATFQLQLTLAAAPSVDLLEPA